MHATWGIFFGGPGWLELVVLGFVGVLIFGRRLPEVGRNVGKGIVEFKKGLSGISDQVESAGAEKDKPQLDDNATQSDATFQSDTAGTKTSSNES